MSASCFVLKLSVVTSFYEPLTPCCTCGGGWCLTACRGQTVVQLLMLHEMAKAHIFPPLKPLARAGQHTE